MDFDLMFIVIGVSIIVLVSICLTFNHESGHVANYNNFGVDTIMGFELNSFRAYTEADFNQWQQLSLEAKNQLKLENSINESVGYNTSVPLIGLMALLVVGFAYLGIKIELVK